MRHGPKVDRKFVTTLSQQNSPPNVVWPREQRELPLLWIPSCSHPVPVPIPRPVVPILRVEAAVVESRMNDAVSVSVECRKCLWCVRYQMLYMHACEKGVDCKVVSVFFRRRRWRWNSAAPRPRLQLQLLHQFPDVDALLKIQEALPLLLDEAQDDLERLLCFLRAGRLHGGRRCRGSELALRFSRC